MLCFIDTCSVLHSFQFTLGKDFLWEYFYAFFQPYISSEVNKEVLRNWDRSFNEIKGLEEVDSGRARQAYRKWAFDKILQNKNQHLSFFKERINSNVDAGEMDLVACLREKAFEENDFPIFFSDDIKALNVLQPIIEKYHLGIPMTTPEMVTYLHVRGICSKDETIQFLKSFLAVYENDFRARIEKIREKVPRKDIGILEDFLKDWRIEKLEKLMKGFSRNKEIKELSEKLIAFSQKGGIQEKIMVKLREICDRKW